MKMESMAHTKDCYYRLVWNFFHFFFVLFSEIVLQTLTTLNVGLLLVLLENEGGYNLPFWKSSKSLGAQHLKQPYLSYTPLFFRAM